MLSLFLDRFRSAANLAGLCQSKPSDLKKFAACHTYSQVLAGYSQVLAGHSQVFAGPSKVLAVCGRPIIVAMFLMGICVGTATSVAATPLAATPLTVAPLAVLPAPVAPVAVALATSQDEAGPGDATENTTAATPPLDVKPAPAKPDGIDVRIDRAFQPIADAWESLVLTAVPYGSSVPGPDSLLSAGVATKLASPENKSKIAELEKQKQSAVQAAINADARKAITQDFDARILEQAYAPEFLAQVQSMLGQREQAIAAADTAEARNAIRLEYKEKILATLSPEQLEAFKTTNAIPIVLLLLVFGASFFTVYFVFINLRRFPLAISVVMGKYDAIEQGTEAVTTNNRNGVDGDVVDTIRQQGHDGEVSHFQALATAVSGTVGLGNIAGVAIAIATGGPGATFWMIVCGLIGMSTKFVECTLGVQFRDVDADGTVHGGPMYYLKKGLATMGMAGFGTFLAYAFAILCVGASFGGGNVFQSNQATAQIVSMMKKLNVLPPDAAVAGQVAAPDAAPDAAAAALQNAPADSIIQGSEKFLIGVVLAVLVGLVIIGGIKRIANVTEKIVPFMAILYVLGCMVVIGANIQYLGTAIGQIFSQAFTPQAGLGGIIGVIIIGFQRAAFSNEAGAGSAAIAHSAVKTRYPASEGIVALLEPFIDTVVICTMTALVIIVFNLGGGDVFDYGNLNGSAVKLNSGNGELGGVDLTSAAFGSVVSWFPYVLTLAIVLFAFSTMISWSYYGLQSWKFLFGKSRGADLTYKLLFLAFVVIGAAAELGAVVKFSDAMILALVFPNMIGIFLLAPTVKKELNRYLDAIGVSRFFKTK